MYINAANPVAVAFDRAAFNAARMRKGWSVEMLSRRTGLSFSWCSQINRGMIPSADVRNRIASALEVDAATIWREPGPAAHQPPEAA